MRAIAAGIVLLFMTAAPTAAAADPFLDPTCVDQQNCVGPGTCVAGVGCVPRQCQPVAHCRGELSSTSECAQNVTIQGKTCQLVVGVGGRTNTPGQRVWAGAQLSDGNVDAFNLPNTWIAPSAEANLHANDLEVGTISIGFYRSDIQTEGPRGGVLAPLFDDQAAHDWTHVALVVHRGNGATGAQTTVVGVYLLDGVPEGCYVRPGTPVGPDVVCPRVSDAEQTLP